MFTRRPLWTALAVIAILALSLTITPVRAWASSMLSLFRVQKITVVQFDPAAVEKAQNSMDANQEMIRQIFRDNVKITEKGQYQEVASVDEAQQAAGFTPRLPAALKDAKLAVKPGFHGELTIDQPKMQGLLDAAGVDAKLPESVNGKVVVAAVSSAVIATQGCPASASYGKEVLPEDKFPNCTVLMQMPSPVIDAPDGLDMPQLGQAMFQFLGLPKDQAASLAQRIDWASTLVLPIPQGKGISYQDVQVDGVTGTLLQSTDEPGYMLLWVKDGVIYGLRGPGSAQDGLALAASLK